MLIHLKMLFPVTLRNAVMGGLPKLYQKWITDSGFYHLKVFQIARLISQGPMPQNKPSPVSYLKYVSAYIQFT